MCVRTKWWCRVVLTIAMFIRGLGRMLRLILSNDMNLSSRLKISLYYFSSAVCFSIEYTITKKGFYLFNHFISCRFKLLITLSQAKARRVSGADWVHSRVPIATCEEPNQGPIAPQGPSAPCPAAALLCTIVLRLVKNLHTALCACKPRRMVEWVYLLLHWPTITHGSNIRDTCWPQKTRPSNLYCLCIRQKTFLMISCVSRSSDATTAEDELAALKVQWLRDLPSLHAPVYRERQISNRCWTSKLVVGSAEIHLLMYTDVSAGKTGRNRRKTGRTGWPEGMFLAHSHSYLAYPMVT